MTPTRESLSVRHGWRTERLKYLGRFFGGGTPSKDEPTYWAGEIPWVSPKDMRSFWVTDSEDHITSDAVRNSATRLVPPGSLMMVVRSGILQRTIPLAINEVEVALNQDMKALVPRPDIDARFLAYYIAGHEARLLNEWRRVGATVESLDFELVGNTTITYPALPQQRAIADFLDWKTAAIDMLIANKKRLVSLLRERLESQIAGAVVRGLAGGAVLKESGLAWVGAIPAHWTMKKLRHVARRVDVGIAEAATHAYAAHGVPLLRSTNVTNAKFGTDDLLFIEPWFAERNRSKYLRAGDILSVRTGDAGRSVVVPRDLDRSQCFTLLMTTLKPGHVPDYYCAYINSRVGMTYFDLEGWGTAQKNISVPILASMPVPEPPRDEQVAIARYVIELQARVASSQNAIEVQLATLSEYRQALITAAVTGQLDVAAREVA